MNRDRNTTDEELKKRYIDLYGGSGYEKSYAADRKRLKNDYVYIILVFAVAMLYAAHGMMTAGAGLSEKDGVIVKIERPDESKGSVSYDVRVTAKNGKDAVTDDRVLTVEPEGAGGGEDEESVIGEETEEDKLQRAIDSAVRTVSADGDSAEIVLPTVLEDGTRLIWSRSEKNDIPLILAGMMIVLFAVYKSRFSVVTRKEKEARDSITRDMPGFMNKLVLMLRGGLVLGEALDRITDDARRSGSAERSYFYGQLCGISDNVRKTNGVLHEELAAFAKRSGVRELMRFSNMVKENVEKGADLTEKIEAESEMLWFLRKKHSEEEGRLAETKLTLPLMILIMVLIMVTTAPALMQM